ncbi:HAMP domain-containing sensor histidine kinase [Janthinobacterium sp. J1-1]|uniref:sensor histidine kinase n=1 Tax=Janthinobacterium sp. J1-1 TaxID=3065910 RepID=UPI00281246DA|nr:HAMP domain-containing sensor histidine kinase [Janthinobacterium sp. J1-1]
MKPFKSIGRQIIGAYLLFTAACCLLFITIGAFVIEGIEVRLVDDRLKEVAAWAAPRYVGGLPVEMPSGLSFHHGEGIPTSLRALPEGVQEAIVDGIELHVFGGHTSAGPFVVIDHASDYENVEKAVYSLILTSFIGFLGFSLLLGRYMARRFVSPITSLSLAVAEKQPHLPLLQENNELGALARAFDAYAKEMKHYLDRERFFTGDVSHELRTPLTIIRGAVEILSLETIKHPAMQAPVERINRAIEDASQSVNVLLMLARAPNLIESSEISVGALAQAQVEQYQFLVRDKPVKLTFAGGDFRLKVPAKLLESALGNLIRNACLYTDRGTVAVEITGYKIQVHDTGAGLPDAVMAMLLDEQTGSYVGSEGTGLGLALVKRICEYIGSTLRVVSKSDQGSVIEIDCSTAQSTALTKS